MSQTCRMENTMSGLGRAAAKEYLTSVQAARVLGVGPTSIKRWTDAGLLVCERTPGGHRRFTRTEVERFQHSRSAPRGPSVEEIADWLQLLSRDSSAYDVQAALLRERSRQGSWMRVADLFADVLAELGKRWEKGDWTVLQEHAASESLVRGIARIAESLPVPRPSRLCLLAAAEGEEHTLPLNLAELCLREQGWDARWSGRATPTAELVRTAESGTLDMVALTASTALSDPQSLARTTEVLERVCREREVVLVLGGSGPWPERLAYARRVGRFAEFADLLGEVRAA